MFDNAKTTYVLDLQQIKQVMAKQLGVEPSEVEIWFSYLNGETNSMTVRVPHKVFMIEPKE